VPPVFAATTSLEMLEGVGFVGSAIAMPLCQHAQKSYWSLN
jgi:hypothetical protein